MVGEKSRGHEIRQYILGLVEQHPREIAKLTAQHFGISRQAVNKHLKRLLDEGQLHATGSTRNRSYFLKPILVKNFQFPIGDKLAEDIVWRENIEALLSDLPENILDIWYYGFTEMVNNVIDHSGSNILLIDIEQTATATTLLVTDRGEGIFNKIQHELGLAHPSDAIIELAKGKFTTDPEHHTGEGIFFTSRIFDHFEILSSSLYYAHGEEIDWLADSHENNQGTTVAMKIGNNSDRKLDEVFDLYASEQDDYGFTKTIVPVRAIRFKNERLVSRSQAKRLIVRFEHFKEIVLDFIGVDNIGQAFADEIFRVFTNSHPDIKLSTIHTNMSIDKMIKRAQVK